MNKSILFTVLSLFFIGLFSDGLQADSTASDTTTTEVSTKTGSDVNPADNTDEDGWDEENDSLGFMANNSEYMHAIFKWFHVIAGVLWIGLLYFFNWVNGHFAATLDADTKKKVFPELMPRTLYWFRWGAAWTWVTGILLLYVVFWWGMSDTMFSGEQAHWAYLLPFVMVFVYDALYNSPLGSSARIATIVSFLGVAAVLCLLTCVAGMDDYRSYNIHIGAMFGSMMAFNVWFRIWPAQQKIITAIRDGDAPDGDLVALAGLRSKHNTYMSVPLIWTMINGHTIAFNGIFGLPQGVELMIVIALGWHIVFQLYRKSAKIAGF